MVAIARPAFGLPTIIEETEMPNWHLLFSIIPAQPGLFVGRKQKHPQSSIRLRVLTAKVALSNAWSTRRFRLDF
jgi:hypothetical protein